MKSGVRCKVPFTGVSFHRYATCGVFFFVLAARPSKHIYSLFVFPIEFVLSIVVKTFILPIH